MITASDKLKVTQYVMQHASGDLYYEDFKEFINKKKCSDIDLFSFFVFSCENYLQRQMGTYKSFVKYIELIGIFIQVIAQNKMEVNKDLLEKVFHLKEKVDKLESIDYVRQKEELQEIGTFIKENFATILSQEEVILTKEDCMIKQMEKTLQHQEQTISMQSQDLEKKKQKIEEQREKLQNLRTQKLELENTVQELESTKKYLERLLEEYREKLSVNEDLVNELKEKVLHLNSKLSSLGKKYQDLESKIRILEQELQEKEESLYSASTRLENSSNINAMLRSELEQALARIRVLECENEKRANIEKIDEIILKNLYLTGHHILDLKNILKLQGFSLTFEEVVERIKFLSLQFSIDSYVENGLFYYKISSPGLKKGTTYDLRLVNLENLNLLLVADYHLGEHAYSQYEVFASILDYCKQEHIRNVIHLGDFFDFNRYAKTPYTYEKFLKYQELVAQIIEQLPFDSQVNHLVLGGNHDEDHLNLGVDLLKHFTTERLDFSFLGYQNSMLNISYHDTTVGRFLLSHPYRQVERKDLGRTVSRIIFKNQMKYKPDFTFFGHHHASFLDIQNKSCIVPSLTLDRIYNGAWHVTLNFKDSYLHQLSFKPLILERKLIPTTEILCQVSKR